MGIHYMDETHPQAFKLVDVHVLDTGIRRQSGPIWVDPRRVVTIPSRSPHGGQVLQLVQHSDYVHVIATCSVRAVPSSLMAIH